MSVRGGIMRHVYRQADDHGTVRWFVPRMLGQGDTIHGVLLTPDNRVAPAVAWAELPIPIPAGWEPIELEPS